VEQRGHCKSRGLYIFFLLLEKKRISSIGNRFFVHNTIISGVKSVDFLVIRYRV